MTKTTDVIVVGGGTAGWLAAARLAAMSCPSVTVTLIESAQVPTVGVGEGTWPSMRATLKAIGLAESDLIRCCDASLKQGTLFRGWRNGADGDQYLHPFSLPPSYADINVADFWRVAQLSLSFAEVVTPQSLAVTAGCAPKTADMPDYAFALNYGYHLDAVKFATLLRNHCVMNLGVRHVSGHVKHTHRDGEGFISHLALDDGRQCRGDLFIDCTGQRALLLEGTEGEAQIRLRNVLPNNRAVVTQVPYLSDDESIASCTLSTAQQAGWIWDIGLQTRRGVGYVHDADAISLDEAEAALRAYVASTTNDAVAADVKVRALNFEPGYRPKPWVGNCVAVGLSAGFIEPLEASALALIEQATNYLVDNFPVSRALMAPVARGFNAKMEEHWDSIVEFLKLHYALSERDDSPYWRKARDHATIPEALKDKLMLWQIRAPWHADTPRVDALFPAASYQYVWLGMGGHRRRADDGAEQSVDIAELDRLLNSVREKARKLSVSLPSNRQLLTQLRQPHSRLGATTS